MNAQQAYIAEILADLLTSTPECAALWAPRGRVLREGEVMRNPQLADALELLAAHGAEPFYRGEIAQLVCAWLAECGGSLRPGELASYRAIERPPVRVRYRDREVLTNPPPSAGGTLLAYALALLDRGPQPPPLTAVLAAMEAAQAERTPAFVEGLPQEDFLERFLASKLGSTTHISVLDARGRACSVTCTNGEGSGVIVPGTGIHLNNILGEQDLNPLGFHRHPPGRRLPSMVSPTIVLLADQRSRLADRSIGHRMGSPLGQHLISDRSISGQVELVLGSAGSNRIRSALLQTIIGVVDRGLSVEEAVRAPRVHFEDGIIYHEPGLDLAPVRARDPDREIIQFHSLNLFFGGVQAVRRAGGHISGAGDPRRGGVALSV
jgi:gamma-glutamyltranspeptidase/glutathione hydrolase